MFERIMGVLTLKAPTYKAIADDKSLTQEAMMIVIVVAVVNNLVSGIVAATTGGFSIVAGLAQAVIGIIFGLISWYASAWLLAFVAKSMFQGKTEIDEMLRVTGYVYVFNLVGVLSILGLIAPALLCITGLVGLVAMVLSLIGYVIGVREAAEFSTQNAVITAVIVAVAVFIISAIAGAVGAAVMVMFA